MTLMANYWAKKGWKIELITFDDGNNPPHYHLYDSVNHIPLGIASESSNFLEGLINNIKRIYVLRKILTQIKPHAVISFLDKTNVITLLALTGTRIPKVISERNDPFYTNIGKIWNILRRFSYQSADAIVVQVKEFKRFFPERIRQKIHLISNPIVSSEHYALSSVNNDPKNSIIISVGKLQKQKGFDILIRAFSKLHQKYPQWTIIILGEGKSRPGLENLRKSFGLESKILLPGKVSTPIPYLEQADIFILPSRYEGFSNALCEAMACGKAVIATDCPGNRAIIRDGTDGLLVPRENVSALAEAMELLMSNPKKRKSLSLQANEVVDRFRIDKIMRQWDEILKQIHASATVPGL